MRPRIAAAHNARIHRLSKLEGLGSFGDKSRSQVRGFFLAGLSVAARRCELVARVSSSDDDVKTGLDVENIWEEHFAKSKKKSIFAVS